MIRVVCVGLLMLGWALAQNTVRVVAAADLQYALSEIAQAFLRQNPGLKVELSFGSSGKIYTQIVQGLPADIYFSADEAFPHQLEQAGRTVPGTLRLYAVGRMVIWASNRLVQQGLDPRQLGPRILLDPRVTRLAVANPVHAPYGRAGVTLLERFGLLRPTRPARWEEMTAGIPAYYDCGPPTAGQGQLRIRVWREHLPDRPTGPDQHQHRPAGPFYCQERGDGAGGCVLAGPLE